MKKNILIIGNSAKESALAKILSEQFEVFVAPGNDGMKEFATVVDIRENNIIELLNFAMENDITFTICCSELAIKLNISELFSDNGLMIFAPTAESALFTTNRSVAKKMFYKLRLPTPRFAVYEKKNLALDYIKNCEMPVIIRTDEHKDKNSMMVCPSFNIAKSFIEDCFFGGESKVIIEDYVYGTNFSFYVITDGYKALPLGSVKDYKFSLDGDGGILTEGMGACSPFTKLTFDHEDYIMNEIVYPIINYLAEGLKPFMGIIGFEGVLTPEGDIAITECNPFLKDHDAQGVLALLENDIFELMHACAIGSFSDEYDMLDFKDEFAVSCVLSSGQVKNEIIQGLDEVQEDTLVAHLNTKQNEYTEFETLGDRTLVLTTTAKTMNRASSNLYEEIDGIEFRGKHYRKDLCTVPSHL
ncbi:MAG: hypothetical protein NC200_00390 [Candidatus Gastranaerophilales bacterium]|nr:hypothetical protein [Candidatus Gastranaerophilales bacterium]